MYSVKCHAIDVNLFHSFQTHKQGIVDPMLSIWGQQMFVNEDTDK
jgi:hypothetical protein